MKAAGHLTPRSLDRQPVKRVFDSTPFRSRGGRGCCDICAQEGAAPRQFNRSCRIHQTAADDSLRRVFASGVGLPLGIATRDGLRPFDAWIERRPFTPFKSSTYRGTSQTVCRASLSNARYTATHDKQFPLARDIRRLRAWLEAGGVSAALSHGALVECPFERPI